MVALTSTGGTFTSNTWASRTAANVAVGIDSFTVVQIMSFL